MFNKILKTIYLKNVTIGSRLSDKNEENKQVEVNSLQLLY